MRWMMVCLMMAMVAGCVAKTAPRRSMEDAVAQELELARLKMEVAGLRALTNAAGQEVVLDPQFVEVDYENAAQSEIVDPPEVETSVDSGGAGDDLPDGVSGGVVDESVSDVGGVVADSDPLVRWSVDQPVAADQIPERLPRIVMLSAEWCGPCRTTKQAAGDLIGVDASAVVQVVDIDKRPNYGTEFNVMQAATIPAYFVYRGDGQRITSLRNGASTRAGLEQMAAAAGVSLRPAVEGGLVTAEVRADAVPAGTVLAVLAEHLTRSQKSQWPLAAGLLDVDVDVPDALPAVLSALVLDGTWRSESMGLKLTLPESSTLSKSGRRLEFSQPLLVSLKRGPVSVSAELHGITLAADGRELCLDLRGRGLLPVPDLTVVFR